MNPSGLPESESKPSEPVQANGSVGPRLGGSGRKAALWIGVFLGAIYLFSVNNKFWPSGDGMPVAIDGAVRPSGHFVSIASVRLQG